MQNIILTPQYILGLTDAEGMFGLIVKKGGGPTGNKFSLEFKITQKAHSRAVLEAIMAFFGCGRIAVDNAKDGTLKYVVTDIVSITTIIIPFFKANTLLTSKQLNFLSFASMANIIVSGAHLTKDGAEELLNLYSKIKALCAVRGLDLRNIISAPGFARGRQLILLMLLLNGFKDSLTETVVLLLG